MKRRRAVPRRLEPQEPTMCRTSPLTVAIAAILALPVAGHAAEELEAVVVTAQKRTESLQKVPTAVTVVSGETIQELGITRAEDLVKLSPGLAGTKAGGVLTQFYIRGVGNYGTNAFAEAAVATSFNGVNLSRPTTLDAMYFDLERVELLKGPQGTLYGRNATGGAVNIIAKRPTRDLEGSTGVEFGNYSARKVNAALSGPVTDAWSLRGAAQWVERDGFFSDGYEDEDTRAVRFTALYEPSDAVSWLTTIDYEDIGGKGGGGAITPYLEPGNEWIGATDPRSNAVLTAFSLPFTRGPIGSPEGFTDILSFGIASELNWNLDTVSLTVLPAFRHSEVEYLSWAPGFQVYEYDKTDTASLELRLASTGDGRLQWVAGAFYMDEDTSSDGYFLQQVRVWSPPFVFPPTLGPLSPNENSTVNHYDLTTEAWALFGQGTLSVTDELRFTAGFRYTSEDKGMEGWNRTNPPDFPGPSPAFSITTPGSGSWSETTWRAGVEYDLTEDSLVYANISTGFKAGGFFSEQPASQAACSTGNTFEPETLTAYAIGTKNRFNGGRLQLNAEAFYWDYEDHQEPHLGFSACGYTIFPTENIGQATMQGLDLEMQLAVADNGRLGLQLQYLDATFDEFSFTTFSGGGNPGDNGGNGAFGCPASALGGPLWLVNCDGKDAIRAPEWSGTVSYRHLFPVGNGGNVILDLRTQFASETFIAIDYRPASLQGSYSMSDASLAYEAAGGKWMVSVWGRNLEDEAVKTNSFTTPFTLVNYTQLRAPRTWGVSAGLRF
jgi:iron complex outermembrane receptor protein